jgi:O-antigen/teichoic acid export membrane protein
MSSSDDPFDQTVRNNVAPGYSGMGSVTRGSLWSIGAWLLVAGGGLPITVVLVRGMTARAYGTFALAFAIVSLISVASGFGLSSAVTQLVAAETSGPDKQGAIAAFRPAMRLGLVSALTTAGGFAIFFIVVESVYNTIPPLACSVLALSPLAITAPLWGCMGGLLRSTFRPAILAVSSIFGVVVWAVFVVLAFINDQRSALVVSLARSTSYLVAGCVLAVAVGTWWRRSRGHTVSSIPMGRVVSQSAAMLLSAVFVSAVSQLDVLMLGIFRGTVAVGNYQPMSRLNDAVLSLPLLIGGFFLPAATRLASSSKVHELRGLFYWSSRWNFVLCAPALALILACPAASVHLLFGSTTSMNPAALRILGLGALCQISFGLNGLALDAFGKARIVAARSALAIPVSAVVCLVLIPPFGSIGAAVATLVALLLVNILCAFQLHKTSGIRPFDVKMALLIFVFLCSLVATYFLSLTTSSPFATCLLTAGVVGVVVFVASLFLEDKETRRHLLQWLQSRISFRSPDPTSQASR